MPIGMKASTRTSYRARDHLQDVPVSRPKEVEVKCNHQWIEIRKIGKMSGETSEEIFEFVKENGHRLSSKDIKKLRNECGVLVKCANCEEQKQLWEDHG